MAANIVEFAIPDSLKTKLKDEDVQGLNLLAEHINNVFKQFDEKAITKDTLSTEVKALFDMWAEKADFSPDKIKEMNKVLSEQGLEITALKANPQTKAEKMETVQIIFEKALKASNFAPDVNGKYEGFKQHLLDNKRQNAFCFDVKLNTKATMMTPRVTTDIEVPLSTAVQIEMIPGIHEAPYLEPVLFQRLLKGSTNASVIIWINRTNVNGNAAFIGEGDLKPLIDWEYEQETATPKKAAVATKVSTEMLQDFEYIYSEINLLLTRELWREVNDQILNGSGTGDDLRGIILDSVGYTGTGLDGTIAVPNIADALVASMLQMQLLGFNPNMVFVNPTVEKQLLLAKDDTGRYMTSELKALLAQLTIVPTIEIPVGYYLLLDSSRRMVRLKEALRIEFGWENDDFRRNLVTIIAELRLFSYMNSIDIPSCMYEEFNTVITALTI